MTGFYLPTLSFCSPNKFLINNPMISPYWNEAWVRVILLPAFLSQSAQRVHYLNINLLLSLCLSDLNLHNPPSPRHRLILKSTPCIQPLLHFLLLPDSTITTSIQTPGFHPNTYPRWPTSCKAAFMTGVFSPTMSLRSHNKSFIYVYWSFGWITWTFMAASFMIQDFDVLWFSE